MGPWVKSLVLSAAAAVSFGVAEAAEAGKMRVGAWYGEPSFSSAGEFRHCSMIARYANGVSLYFALGEDDALIIGLLEAKLGIPSGEQSLVVLEIDGEWRRSVPAEGSGTLDRIVLGPAPEIVEALRRGRALRVVGSAGAVDLTLKDTADAFAKLRECVGENRTR